jgi:hypothetical protein
MYYQVTINLELTAQSKINPGNATSCTSFRDFVVHVQQFRVYLVMLGGQPHVTMIHTPGVFYSINLGTITYQGQVLAFIGDRWATTEPNLVCLPTTTTWEWHSGNAITDFEAFDDHFTVETNWGTL